MEAHFPTAFFEGKKVHLGVCGSIAAYKALELLRALCRANLRVTVTLTEAAARFVSPLSFQSLGAERVFTSMFAPAGAAPQDSPLSSPFGHLAPGAEADAFVIAPASATTLARLACGLADDLLAAQALAWSGSLLLAPAMNPRMWNNAATRENCATLARREHIILRPEQGRVACGEEGEGKLPDLRLIYLHCLKALSPGDLSGKKVMLTLGPTREPWDAVRFWSNHSSGRMGAALAVCAWLRGAEVYALCGPVAPWLPPRINRLDVITAADMLFQAEKLWPDMDMGIFTAAVADFAPEPFGDKKFKKSGQEAFSISFFPNPDILCKLGRVKKPGQLIVGFAAESERLEENARHKLDSKNADLMVANLIGVPGSGFSGTCNTALILDRKGRRESLPTMPKSDLAWRILDWLSTL
ncbi:MAG: bifunctional phosphopantothenoylcysteine decarboxylase/phosphopantothenate--cysteine ligase CoaBC [Deltaproteobacteria bacterium]|jgi:phosphopantothenoylcysteine decarboxylase/phosphopantothenate--cysteine ligase|nr:bifunctional phosphopantothenoylcysteine decarboxylase/phosphopantothenate--cysteine ligase CoaBC [Deltaproteobacteria bacterium]